MGYYNRSSRSLSSSPTFSSSSRSSSSSSISSTPSSRSSSSASDSLQPVYSLSPSFSNSSQGHSCAFPAWPSGDSLQPPSRTGYTSGSAYISDEDLLPEPSAAQYYAEDYSSSGIVGGVLESFRDTTPMNAAWLPPLQPAKSKKSKKSSRRHRSSSKPMAPIRESPE
ncbi:MAG: hypothetical protein M1827_002560 [Pycnora praestabilis]|nr:MAG: hypothetical protein M1827_002560 [Pycnora praestabilis]